MSTLAQLSHAASEALKDAESNKARIAAHFLRTQLPELFRIARHSEFQPQDLDIRPSDIHA